MTWHTHQENKIALLLFAEFLLCSARLLKVMLGVAGPMTMKHKAKVTFLLNESHSFCDRDGRPWIWLGNRLDTACQLHVLKESSNVIYQNHMPMRPD